ncbi:unnamed protein product [Spirodela intermedia]|uniref:THIF-type NAD/FAD binding fold domain-containing protein n=1 Tax=Spirodela intermedia TaxID=51605 RepID=A0A7I8JD03_SPIIN|nr:unnamed protein product [Spirodela intermedia]CAA6667871.1 unnamed protein product [Spirodela intermedia]
MEAGDGEEELTAQETAVYDRQIRVWGVDAQKRLSKSHVLVSRITGAAVEFCKNVVLAGVGSVTLMDDRTVTEDAIQANFLIPPDENKWKAPLRNSAVIQRVQPNGDLADFEEEFFDKFDVIVVSSCSLANKKKINNRCRRRPKRTAFYTIDCRGSCGEIFTDLQDYTYGQKYPSFEEAISLSWRSLPKKVAKLFFALRVIENFEQSAGRKHGEISMSDLPDVLTLQKQLCEAQCSGTFACSRCSKHPPVCAILGGILGQEVIKGISGKGDPVKNFFFFDTTDGKGIIEDISAAD